MTTAEICFDELLRGWLSTARTIPRSDRVSLLTNELEDLQRTAGDTAEKAACLAALRDSLQHEEALRAHWDAASIRALAERAATTADAEDLAALLHPQCVLCLCCDGQRAFSGEGQAQVAAELQAQHRALAACVPSPVKSFLLYDRLTVEEEGPTAVAATATRAADDVCPPPVLAEVTYYMDEAKAQPYVTVLTEVALTADGARVSQVSRTLRVLEPWTTSEVLERVHFGGMKAKELPF